jgi:peroxiredoxin
MWRNGKRWLSVFALIMSVSLLAPMAVSCSSPNVEAASNKPPAPLVGRMAPDFVLRDMDGNAVRLSDLRGKTVFLNFFATWCVSCQAEMPTVQQAWLKYKDKNVVFLGVDVAEPVDVVRQFVNKGGYTWNFVLDSTQQTTADYHVTGIPTTFFIDKNGVITGLNDSGPITSIGLDKLMSVAMR